MGCYHFLNFPLLLSKFTMNSNKSCRVNVKENSLATNCSSFAEQFYLCVRKCLNLAVILVRTAMISSRSLCISKHIRVLAPFIRNIRISAAFIRE